ncbi:hypothetical protein OIU34_20430 [Pararhizobium sp. BT-229]|uniref:hypothetical protein n=1 Tax=Pararhizobium sp. BT-229 TaxID=2986923 RepID=UPI0021F7A5AD|nr:hypothetical protein [Pararhizobium sp. BT-229]MCV9964256.1 hypothetical protein [Pararhizobium sp. BT-229]
MDETHVYVSVNLTIPKVDLALDDEEARRDALEFGDRGVAYTLENKVRGYLHAEHHAFKNSTPWFAGSDLRAYWRIGEKIFAGHEKLPEPKRTSWDEVLTGAVGTVVMVGSNEGDRASAIRRLAPRLGRPVVEVSTINEDREPVPHEMFHFTLEAGHATRAVVYVTGFSRSMEADDDASNIRASISNALGTRRKNSVMVLGYHSLGDVPVFLWTHPDVRFLFPDNVGCTGFGQGYRR